MKLNDEQLTRTYKLFARSFFRLIPSDLFPPDLIIFLHPDTRHLHILAETQTARLHLHNSAKDGSAKRFSGDAKVALLF